MAKKKCVSWLLILAGLCIGIGVGLAIDQTAPGTLVGLGAGLFAAFISVKIGK